MITTLANHFYLVKDQISAVLTGPFSLESRPLALPKDRHEASLLHSAELRRSVSKSHTVHPSGSRVWPAEPNRFWKISYPGLADDPQHVAISEQNSQILFCHCRVFIPPPSSPVLSLLSCHPRVTLQISSFLLQMALPSASPF